MRETPQSEDNAPHPEVEPPSIGDLLGRSAIPILLLVILAGTPVWGGLGTLVLALVAWRAAGVFC